MFKLGPRLLIWIDRLPIVLGLFGLIFPVARLLAPWDWRADLLSHFQEPALLLSFVAAASLWRRHRWFSLAFLVLAAFQTYRLVRYSFPNPVAPRSKQAPVLRILMANVYCDNDHYDDLARLLLTEKPDIVGFVEYSHEWAAALADLAPEYKYRYEAPDGPRGLALWFRESPVEVAPAKSLLWDAFPFLHARFRFDGEIRELWLVHPSSPLHRLGTHWGFPELDELASEIGQQTGSRIVLGDMNTTDGSPHFADFLKTTGLRDTRLGFGRQASWPTWSPYRIPIDHSFVSADLAVRSRKVLRCVGSDHLAVLLEVSPAAIAASATSAHKAPSSR